LIRKAFVATLQQLVDAGLQGPLAFNLLGDLTSNLDKLAPGEDDEEEAVRFALWKMMGSSRSARPLDRTLSDTLPALLQPRSGSSSIRARRPRRSMSTSAAAARLRQGRPACLPRTPTWIRPTR
jgi:hypothetical protein